MSDVASFLTLHRNEIGRYWELVEWAFFSLLVQGLVRLCFETLHLSLETDPKASILHETDLFAMTIELWLLWIYIMRMNILSHRW